MHDANFHSCWSMTDLFVSEELEIQGVHLAIKSIVKKWLSMNARNFAIKEMVVLHLRIVHIKNYALLILKIHLLLARVEIFQANNVGLNQSINQMIWLATVSLRDIAVFQDNAKQKSQMKSKSKITYFVLINVILKKIINSGLETVLTLRIVKKTRSVPLYLEE